MTNEQETAFQNTFDLQDGTYHTWLDNDGEEYGSFEVFAVSPMEAYYNRQNAGHGDGHTIYQSGWYWWACFPDCLPDGEAVGPFASEAEAEADARDVQ